MNTSQYNTAPDHCAGENCTSTDGKSHSVECLFGHFAAYTGLDIEPLEVQVKVKKGYFDGYLAATQYPPVIQPPGNLGPVPFTEDGVAILMKFYGASSILALIEAQAHHIEKLQAKVPPTKIPVSTNVRGG